MDCGLPGSSVMGFSDKNTGMGCHFLLQGNDLGIEPTSPVLAGVFFFFFYQWATKEAPEMQIDIKKKNKHLEE